MNGFIKRFSDFTTAKTFRAVEWDIVLRSTEDDVSTVVVVAGDVDAGDVGDWLIMAGALLRVESVQIGTATTTVKCRDIASAFARTLLLQDIGAEETVGLFIHTALTQQFRLADDEAYAMPYLSVSSTTEGDIAYHAPETDAYGRFEFDEYLRTMARVHNIHLSWSDSGTGKLKLRIGRGDIRGGQIVLGVGANQLAEEPVFANAEIAKITALQSVEAEDGSESVTKTDYFLYTDGTFGTSATGGERATGGWEYITASSSETADDISEKVAQQFERGMSDSKISFWSELDLTVGAPVVLRVSGRRHSGYISYKGVKSSDKRYFYRCGNRPVTLTERLRAAEKTATTAENESGSSTGSSSGGSSAGVNPYPVGSIYLSVVDTSPETLFGGTWERLKDTFLLAAGDTYAAGTTGGETTHTLTVSEMPSHTHQYGNYYTMAYNYSSGGKRFVAAEVDDLASGLQNTGGGGAHNNMPPYLAVYIWKRTA